MADEKNIDSTAAGAEASDNGRPAIARQPFDRPIVLKYKGSKKGKSKGKRYSKALRDVQRTEARLAKASEKAARAVAKGAETYNDARKKSVKKKRDGAIRDFLPNMAEGFSESLRRSSSIPVDIAEALNTPGSRRMLRNQLRLVSGGWRLWRF